MQNSKFSTKALYAWLLLMAVAFIISLDGFMFSDEGVWHYIGMHCGDLLPYRDAVENKTPGIYYIYALCTYFDQTGLFLPRLLGVFALGITCRAVYLIVKNFRNERAAIFAMLIVGLISCWEVLNGEVTGSTESYMIMFISLCALMLHKACAEEDSKKYIAYMVLAGSCAGAAIAFKQIALASIGGLFILFLSLSAKKSSGKKRGLSAAVVAILVVTFLSTVPLLLSGLKFTEYVDGAWVILTDPSSSLPSSHDNPNIQKQFRDERKKRFVNTWINGRSKIFFLLLLPFLFRSHSLRKSGLPVIALLLWLACDFIGVNASGWLYGKQLRQILPVLAICSGIGLDDLLKKFVPESRQKFYASLTTVLLLALIFPLAQLRISLHNSSSDFTNPFQTVGEFIEKQTDPDARVYIFGNFSSVMQVYTKRRSASRYFNTNFFNTERVRNVVRDDLQSFPPEMIVILPWESHLPEWMSDLIQKNYSQLEYDSGATIYRRNK